MMLGQAAGLARPLPVAVGGVPLALAGASSFGFSLRTATTQDVTVFWGDGSSDTESVGSGADVVFSHTYTGSFTGRIRVKPVNGPSAVTLFSSWTGTLGAIRFTTASLAPFTALATMVANSNGSAFGGPVLALPRSLTNLQLGGTMVSPGGCTGSPADLPPNLVTCIFSGSLHAVAGALSAFPDSISTLNMQGACIITGAVQDAPTSCVSLHIRGLSTLSGYNGTPWKAGTQNVSFVRLDNALNVLSSGEVDELINDLNAQAARPSNGSIFLAGTLIGARTAASDAAVTALQAAGWTVSTNT